MQINITLNDRDREFEVDFEVDWDNDGIGHFECWGHTGFDEGNNYISDVTVTEILLNHDMRSRKICWDKLNKAARKKILDYIVCNTPEPEPAFEEPEFD
jgi:hypothetical protein